MNRLLTFSLVATLSIASTVANAVPLLQMYVEGGTYDASTQTWVTSETSFDVWVIGNIEGEGGKGALTDVTLVATVIGGNLADVSITGSSTSYVTDPSVAADPIADVTGVGAHHSLASHGIFEGTNVWQDFLLGDMTLTDSPIGDATQGGFPVSESGTPNAGQINVYHVEMLGAYESIHFDGFGYYSNKSGEKYTFAPFSHDAESTPRKKIPEPGIALLLGLGVLLLPRLRK